MKSPSWTPAEDALIRKAYKRRAPLRSIVEKLPGRTLAALKCHARRLQCIQRPHWTAAEDRILRTEWGLIFSRRGMRAKLPGRTWCAIARRAQTLKLGSPARGLVTLLVAARTTGYSFDGLRGVLLRQGVTVRRHCGCHEERRSYSQLLVDMLDVEEAVAKDIREVATTETLAEAAARHGVAKPVMRRMLVAAGVDVLRRGQPGRLNPLAVDAAMRGERAEGMCQPVPVAHPRPRVVRCGATVAASAVAS